MSRMERRWSRGPSKTITQLGSQLLFSKDMLRKENNIGLKEKVSRCKYEVWLEKAPLLIPYMVSWMLVSSILGPVQREANVVSMAPDTHMKNSGTLESYISQVLLCLGCCCCSAEDTKKEVGYLVYTLCWETWNLRSQILKARQVLIPRQILTKFGVVTTFPWLLTLGMYIVGLTLFLR